MQELYKLGARRLVLLDILPVGCLPSQRAITANGECNDDGNYVSGLFNSLLRTEMAKASMPGMKYSIASVYNVFSDMITNPTLAGNKPRTFLFVICLITLGHFSNSVTFET
jgi:hypothetical protein